MGEDGKILQFRDSAEQELLSLRAFFRRQRDVDDKDERLVSELLRLAARSEIRPRALGAVLVPLFIHDGELRLLYTKRSKRLAHHRGEVAFPGGKQDSTDPNLLMTALREAEEEIGLSPQRVEVLGRLPFFEVSRSGVAVVPYVSVLSSLDGIVANTQEVEEVFSVPISVLRDPGYRITYHFDHPDGSRSAHPAIAYEGRVIWGLTLRITLALLRCFDCAKASPR